jgi:hypothetical protein
MEGKGKANKRNNQKNEKEEQRARPEEKMSIYCTSKQKFCSCRSDGLPFSTAPQIWNQPDASEDEYKIDQLITYQQVKRSGSLTISE